MSTYCRSLLKLVFSGVIFLALPFTSAAAEPVQVDTPPAAASGPAATQQIQTAAPLTPPGSFRVGYADIMKIAEQSDAGKTAKAHFEVKADKHKLQIETKQKLLEKQKAALEAKLPTYTTEQRIAKIKEYEKKVEEFRRLLQKADKEMKPMQEELLKGIYGKIEAAARSYGEANGFDVILTKSELLYLGKNADVKDVTEELIRLLNRKND